ncbi:MAG: DUF721 domain-containing protein [Sedimentisphaerales bacterium]|nr:DUF721 domain-containing protein [Sedimentisphaerales bacterium]
MDEWNNARLRRVTKQRCGRNSYQRLGETLGKFIHKSVLPQQERFSSLGAAWAELLPAELLDHTNFANLRRGKLTVQVDSAAHLFELKLILAEGLLDEIQGRCPHANLREIKLQLGDRRPRKGSAEEQEKE